jgi:hypothetical protein
MTTTKTSLHARITSSRLITQLRCYAELLSDKRGYRISATHALTELASELLPLVIARLEAERDGRLPSSMFALAMPTVPQPGDHDGGHHAASWHTPRYALPPHHDTRVEQHGHSGAYHGSSGTSLSLDHRGHGNGTDAVYDGNDDDDDDDSAARKPSMAELMRSLDDFE